MLQQFPHLLSPYKIGGITVKNRMTVAPMGHMEILDKDGVLTDNGLAYFTERAKGGFGLITVPAFHPDEEIDPVIFKCYKGNEAAYTLKYKMLIDNCCTYGAKVFIQISFGLGRNGPVGCHGPSEIPYFGDPEFTTPPLTRAQIKRKIELVVEACKFVKSIGFDGVEMHAMHWGYLLDQFAMAYTNHRTDEYGGCLENRLRVAKELVEGIKAACGKDFPVCMRLGLRTYMRGYHKPGLEDDEEVGRDLAEAVEISKLLERYGYDILSVDMGVYDSYNYLFVPPYVQQGHFNAYAEAVKKVVNIPVVLAGGRLNDPELTEKAIAEGKIDGVVYGRQSMADPHYPKKIEMGRPDKIRPCIGCNLGCGNEAAMGKHTCCAVNPTALKEGLIPAYKALFPKKIAVIGAGVAGMEFARTAASRGHQVEIYEKSDNIGGLLIPAGHHGFKVEIQRLNTWYQNELKELNVPIHTGREMNADDIKALGVDAVIITSGAEAIMPRIPGIDHPKVVDFVSASTDKVEMGNKVIVIGGGPTGCEIAYDLVLKGKEVSVVDALDELMINGTALSNKVMMLELFRKYNVEVLTGHRIEEINDVGAVISDKDGNKKTIPADNIVMAIGFKPVAPMAQALYGTGMEVYEVPTGIYSILGSVRSCYEIARNI